MTSEIENFDVKTVYFRCHICELEFKKRLEYRRHLLLNHNQTDLLFECPYCKNSFESTQQLKVHEKTHGEYSCDVCGQKFMEKVYLDLHLKTHEKNRTKFSCSLCDKKFLFKGNLKVHFKNKHLHQTFKCVICDKELSTHQKLKQHIQKKHENKNDSFVISINQLNDAFNQDESDYQQNI